jgi:WD40 repeat protein
MLRASTIALMCFVVQLLVPSSTPAIAGNACPIRTRNPHEVARLGRGIVTSASANSESLIAVGSSVGVWIYTPLFDDVAFLETADVLSVDWTADGTRLAVGKGDGTVQIWNAGTWTCAMSVRTNHPERVTSVQWNNTGSQFATLSMVSDWTVQVWNEDGSLHATLDNIAIATSLAWSPDGTQIAIGGATALVNVFDVNSARLTKSFEGHTGYVISVAWSPDRIASTGTDGVGCADDAGLANADEVRIWDAVSGVLLQTLPSFLCASEHPISFSPDGKLLAGVTHFRDTGVNIVRLWDIENRRWMGSSMGSLEAQQNIIGIEWLPDLSGLLALETPYSVRGTSHVMIWDALGNGSLRVLNPIGHSLAVTAIAWSPDGQRIVSLGAENHLNLWEVATAQLLYSIGGDNSLPIVWSPEGSKIAYVRRWYDFSNLMIQDVVGIDEIGVDGEIALNGTATSMAWSRDNTLYRLMRLEGMWQLHATPMTGTGSTEIYPVSGVANSTCVMTLANDEPIIAVSSYGTTSIYRPLRGADPVATIRVRLPTRGHDHVQISPDGTKIAFLPAYGGNLTVWSIPDGELLSDFDPADSEPYRSDLKWSTDSQFLAVSSYEEDGVALFHARSGQHRGTLLTGEVQAITWAPEGGKFATANSDGTVRIWDVEFITLF